MSNDSWAKKAVEKMTPAEVRHWCERLGIDVRRDTRSPIERLVDDAVKPTHKPRKRVRR